MNLCLPTVGPSAAEDTIQRVGPVLGSLSIHGLAHDRAAASEDLEIGHGASTGRNMASGGEGSKSGGRCFVKKRAHRAGLPEERLHVDELKVQWQNGEMVNWQNGYLMQLTLFEY